MIVVLFVVTILLLYFLWEDSFKRSLRLPMDLLSQGNDAPVTELSEIMDPARLVVNFGGETHTILTGKQLGQWDALVAEFGKFSEAGTVTLKEITKAQYDEALKVRSVRAEFSYWLPFTDTLAYFDIAAGADYSKVEAFSAIAYSTAIPESILVYDGKNKKYYRLTAETDRTAIGVIIDEIEAGRFGAYFPMGSFLGISNPTLMPIALQTNMRALPFDIEIKYYEEEKIVDYAKTFFGEGFDFVRKITENDGTVIYMYGYGQKNLIIDPNGTIEYREELNDTGAAQVKFYEAMDTALLFIDTHGGWSSLNDSELTPYLKKVNEIKIDDVKGYEFIFGMMIDGNPLFYTDNAEILSVGVVGGKVVRFKREMTDIEANILTEVSERAVRDTLDPINILTENYKFIKSVLNENGITVAGETDTELFENTASLIDRIETGYVRIENGQSTRQKEIYPAWAFTVGKIRIYFNIYTGEILGTSGGAQGGS